MNQVLLLIEILGFNQRQFTTSICLKFTASELISLGTTLQSDISLNLVPTWIYLVVFNFYAGYLYTSLYDVLVFEQLIYFQDLIIIKSCIIVDNVSE